MSDRPDLDLSVGSVIVPYHYDQTMCHFKFTDRPGLFIKAVRRYHDGVTKWVSWSDEDEIKAFEMIHSKFDMPTGFHVWIARAPKPGECVHIIQKGERSARGVIVRPLE